MFEKPFYWEPNINDIKPYIQFNFENIYEIAIIDIIGYLKKFKLEYLDINKNWINIPNIYSGIEISKTNYINKIYLPETIKCIKIKINPLEYENIRSLKIKLYKRIIMLSSISIFYFLNGVNYIYTERLKHIEEKKDFIHPLKILIISPNKKFIEKVINKTKYFTYGNCLLFINLLIFVLNH